MNEYENLTDINDTDKQTLISIFKGILSDLKHVSINKITAYLSHLPVVCKLHHNSVINKRTKNSDPNKFHPVKPVRGEIYNAILIEGIGSELAGNHLVIIMQNKKGNIYGEKVNVLPIEGNGNNVNPAYQVKLSNTDLDSGQLDKNPSRIIITDITTIDKARLQRKIGLIKPTKMAEISKKLVAQLEL